MQHPKQSAMILARKFDLFVNDLTHVLIAELLRSLSLVRAGARGRVEATTASDIPMGMEPDSRPSTFCHL